MNTKPHRGLDEMIDTVEKSWDELADTDMADSVLYATRHLPKKNETAIIKDLLVKKYGIDPYLISLDCNNISFGVQGSDMSVILNGDINDYSHTLDIGSYRLKLSSFRPDYENNTSMLMFTILLGDDKSAKPTKNDQHINICDELHNIYLTKNADYGDSFTKIRDEIPYAILVRIGDKYNRLKNLMLHDSEQQVDESIKDTLMDLANYCIMEIMEMEE